MSQTQTQSDSAQIHEMIADRRRNLADASGTMWYVVDEHRERIVAGPFGSESYAHTVRERTNWLGEHRSTWSDDLVVDSIDVIEWCVHSEHQSVRRPTVDVTGSDEHCESRLVRRATDDVDDCLDLDARSGAGGAD